VTRRSRLEAPVGNLRGTSAASQGAALASQAPRPPATRAAFSHLDRTRAALSASHHPAPDLGRARRNIHRRPPQPHQIAQHLRTLPPRLNPTPRLNCNSPSFTGMLFDVELLLGGVARL
jgi:hypothetical protein